jgi:hypothetical protein
VLVAALSHFPKLEPELELLGSERDADLRDDQRMPSGLTGIACPFFIGPRSFERHGVVPVSDRLFFCLIKYGRPG